MKLVYFAWVREVLGRGAEELAPPPEVDTVAKLLDWLAALDADHARALERRAVLKVAVNLDMAQPDTPVGPGDEVAIFPPMTGG